MWRRDNRNFNGPSWYRPQPENRGSFVWTIAVIALIVVLAVVFLHS